MSRTYKDRPARVRFPEAYDWRWNCEKIPYDYTYSPYGTGDPVTVTRYVYRELPGVKTKKRREVDCDWHWMGATPSWWTRMTMNRPQRREAHLWEHDVARTSLEELEEVDKPNASHKPHIYYY